MPGTNGAQSAVLVLSREGSTISPIAAALAWWGLNGGSLCPPGRRPGRADRYRGSAPYAIPRWRIATTRNGFVSIRELVDDAIATDPQ
jgi:hypothetical protein